MEEPNPHDESRRRLLRALAAAPFVFGSGLLQAGGCAGDPVEAQPTPSCPDDDEPTPAQTEGPFFTPSSPRRTRLREPGMAGTALVVSGAVLTRACRPIPGALLDFWQADAAGEYDLDAYRLRGHQFTDPQGRYRLETIVPGLYAGRTRHIHVKVQAPNRPILTTQLYFPGEARNASDGIFHARLLMGVADVAGGREAAFDFVLDVP